MSSVHSYNLHNTRYQKTNTSAASKNSSKKNGLIFCSYVQCATPTFDQILAEKKCVLYKRLYGIYKSYPYPMNYNAEFDCVKKRKKI